MLGKPGVAAVLGLVSAMTVTAKFRKGKKPTLIGAFRRVKHRRLQVNLISKNPPKLYQHLCHNSLFKNIEISNNPTLLFSNLYFISTLDLSITN